MKILKIALLSVLVTLCAAITVGVVLHFRNDGVSDSTRVSIPSDDAVVDDFIPVEGLMFAERPERDTRFRQRAMMKQEETGLWQYFPIIPWDVRPGEVATLSVSSTDFMGWEVDTIFADVELFDEKIDDENAVVSFIMPEETVYIAALYTEVPHINFENERAAVMLARSMIEDGSTIAATSDIITPQPARPTRIPALRVGETSTIRMINPTADAFDNPIPSDATLRWVIPPTPNTFPPSNVNRLPDGMTLSFASPPGEITTSGGIEIRGAPTLATTTRDFEFYFELYYADGTPIGTFDFIVTIFPAGSDPVIATKSIPHAMVGVYYDVPIDLAFLLPGQEWAIFSVLTVGGETYTMPEGLVFDFDRLNNDTTKWYIRGTPLEASAGATPNFIITLDQQNTEGFSYVQLVSEPFNLRVWGQPTISLSDSVNTGLTSMLPGIENSNGVTSKYDVLLAGNGSTVSPATPYVDEPTIPTKWEWSIFSGTQWGPPPPAPQITVTSREPDGLKLERAVGVSGNNLASISGNPSKADVFTFTIRYRADPDVLIGEIYRTYSIEIYSPPMFETAPDGLDDGMDWRDPATGILPVGEPPDVLYNTEIDAIRFPNDSAIDWNWDVKNLPYSPSGDGAMTFGTLGNDRCIIKGLPQTDNSAIPDGSMRMYQVEVEVEADVPGNPNIDGATISRTFDLRVWPRRYLYIDNLDANRSYVRRAATKRVPVDVNWDGQDWDRSSEAPIYRTRRAVMPGTNGEIRVPLPGSGFTRWEVIRPADVGYSNSNTNVNIGSNWGTGSNGLYNYVLITMPDFERNADGTIRNTTPIDGDVYIQGDDSRQPQWGWLLNDGRVGDTSSGGHINFASGDAGGGGRATSWVLVNDPQGLFDNGLDWFGSNFVCIIMSDPSTGPTRANFYEFEMGIILPGSMMITRWFDMTIDPPNNRLGDVNGDGNLDLTDLVLLARFVRNEISTLPRMDLGNIVSSPPARPGMADFNALAAYFARIDATLSQVTVID